MDTRAVRYIGRWNLRPDGAAMETRTSWLYPVRHAGAPAMLKILKPGSDEQSGAALLRYFNGRGAVHLLRADSQALLTERGGTPLVALAARGGDDEAAVILADIVIELHGARAVKPPAGLTPLKARFRALFTQADATPLIARCAEAAHDLLARERDILVLHGDLHHENILESPRGWLAIDPKGLVGERTYDVANLLTNPRQHGEIVHRAERMQRLAAFYAARLALDRQRLIRFALAHAGLAASWSMEDGDDPTYWLRCAEVLAPLA